MLLAPSRAFATFALFAALASPLLSGCGPAKSAAASSGTSAEPAAVRTVRPSLAEMLRTVEQPGQIEGFEQTPLYAKIAGYVLRWNVDIGDTVKQGQVLAELSVPENEEDLRQKEAAEVLARAGVEQAGRALKVSAAAVATAETMVTQTEAGLARAEATAQRWRNENQRAQSLLPSRSIDRTTADATTDQLKSSEAGLVEVKAAVEHAKAARDEAVAKRDQAESDVRVAEAKLQVAEADRRRAAAMLAYREIRAPFDGVVTRRNVDTGHFLQPAVSGTASGTALFVVVRTDIVKVMIDVPESDAHGVKAGTVAKVRIPALGEREFEGKVTRTSMALDQQSRTLRAQIELPNADGVLRPGLYVSARIGSGRSGVLTVPASAVFVQDDQATVVRVEAGKAVRTPVKLGARQGDRVELLRKQTHPAKRGEPIPWEDLTGTEELIAEKPAGWADGQPVRAEPAVQPRTGEV